MTRGPAVSRRYLDDLEAFARKQKLHLPQGFGEGLEQSGALHDAMTWPQFATLMEHLAEQSRNDAFGLRFGEALNPRPDGVLSHILSNCRTLRDAFLAIARFSGALADAFHVRYEEDERAGWLIFVRDSALGSCRHFIDGQLTLVAMRTRQLTGSQTYPLRVEFRRERPDDLREFHRVFGRELAFSAGCDRIGYGLDTMSMTLSRSANFATTDRAGIKALKQAERPLSNSVSNFIFSALQRGEATEQNTCRALGRSRRTLQRELASEGTTFANLLSKARESLAKHYLADTDLSLTAIAFLLGYSEQSALSRAARSWLGEAPSVFRAKSRQRNQSGDKPN